VSLYKTVSVFTDQTCSNCCSLCRINHVSVPKFISNYGHWRGGVGTCRPRIKEQNLVLSLQEPFLCSERAKTSS